MPSSITVPMSLQTALGDTLRFKAMTASEELGRLFEFDVDAVADDGAIKPGWQG